MKKFVCLLLAAMLALLFTGCSKGNPQVNSEINSTWGTAHYAAEHIPLEVYRGIYGATVQEDAIYLTISQPDCRRDQLVCC